MYSVPYARFSLWTSRARCGQMGDDRGSSGRTGEKT